MDILELLNTTRDQKIATHWSNLKSLFSSSVQNYKSSQNRKVSSIKSRKSTIRSSNGKLCNGTPTQTSLNNKALLDSSPNEFCLHSQEEFISRFTSSSNQKEKSGEELVSLPKEYVCSESTGEKFSSSSNCCGIQEFLMPSTASSSYDSRMNNNLEYFSPARCPRKIGRAHV